MEEFQSNRYELAYDSHQTLKLQLIMNQMRQLLVIR